MSISCKIALGECQMTSLRISQRWFRKWLGAIRQHAITGANVDLDLCSHMMSLGHNESTHFPPGTFDKCREN